MRIDAIKRIYSAVIKTPDTIEFRGIQRIWITRVY